MSSPGKKDVSGVEDVYPLCCMDDRNVSQKATKSGTLLACIKCTNTQELPFHRYEPPAVQTSGRHRQRSPFIAYN